MGIIIIFAAIIFIAYVSIKWYVHPLNRKTKEEDNVIFTTAISAMKTLGLIRIIVNSKTSDKIRREALYYLKRDNAFVFYKVINRYGYSNLKLRRG